MQELIKVTIQRADRQQVYRLAYMTDTKKFYFQVYDIQDQAWRDLGDGMVISEVNAIAFFGQGCLEEIKSI